jgi:hypothetical protein
MPVRRLVLDGIPSGPVITISIAVVVLFSIVRKKT